MRLDSSIPVIASANRAMLADLSGDAPDLRLLYPFHINRLDPYTPIAEYKTQLPDRKLLQKKLHEFYLQNDLTE